MKAIAALAAASLLGALAVSAVPWAALVARVQIPEPYEGPVVRVVVEPGETLWQLARRYYPRLDPRQVIDWIRHLNPGLDPGRLRVGQVLQLPVATEIAGGVE